MHNAQGFDVKHIFKTLPSFRKFDEFCEIALEFSDTPCLPSKSSMLAESPSLSRIQSQVFWKTASSQDKNIMDHLPIRSQKKKFTYHGKK